MAQAIVAAAHDCSGAGGGQAVRAAWPVPGSSGFGKPVLPAAPSRAQHKDTQTAGRAGTGCRRVSPRDQGRVAAPAVKRLTIVPLLGTAASLFGAAACGETVATSPTDTTPPTVGLDTFGIPLPAGATTRENPLSVDRACCDLSRTVGNDQLSFIAGAATRTLVCGASAYWVETSLTCVVGGSTTTAGPTLLGKPMWENRDTSTTPPASAVTEA
jgi:hypothetical protein